MVHLNFDQMPANVAALPRLSKPCLIFWQKHTLSPRVSQWQMWLCNILCWNHLNASQSICWVFSGPPVLHSHGSKYSSSATNPRATVSYCQTATHYRLDWLKFQMRSANLQHLICCNESYDRNYDSPVYLKVVELCIFDSFEFKLCMWPQLLGEPQICDWQMIWSPRQHHVQHSTYAIHREIGQPETCNAAYQLTSTHIGHQ